jgi:hypothetical protein
VTIGDIDNGIWEHFRAEVGDIDCSTTEHRRCNILVIYVYKYYYT